MFGIDKGKIKEAFIRFRKQIAIIKQSKTEWESEVDVRLENIEQLIEDLSQAFD